MTWRDAMQAPLSRLRIRTKAVIVIVDDVTDEPPAVLPTLRLQEVRDREAVDVDSQWTRTLGGAALFDRHAVVDGVRAEEHYRLIVEADAIHRPDRPRGYDFTVGTRPDRWPVRLDVRLLPGPAYDYPPRLPVFRGLVFQERPERPVVQDAFVLASHDDGVTVAARCGTDHLGSFSLGISTWADNRRTTIRARAPGGAASAWRRLRPRDLERPVHLTVRP